MKNILLIDLFKVDTQKKEMILIKEPYGRDTVLKLEDKEVDTILNRYSYFLYKQENGIATFGQDLSDETNMSYHTRKMFKKEYGKYYQ